MEAQVSTHIPKIQRLNCLDIYFPNNKPVINLDLKKKKKANQHTERLLCFCLCDDSDQERRGLNRQIGR